MDLIPAIDIHAHPQLGQSSDEGVSAGLKEAFMFGVRTVCVLGNVTCYGEHPNEKQVRAINDESIRLVKSRPEVFVGFCFLNPENDRRFIEEEIDRCIKLEGFKGIKLWISVSARDRRMDILMEKAGFYGIPVLQHTWYKAMGNRGAESTPSDIAVLAARFPGVKIIMGHMGGCGMRGIIDIEKMPNVYTETSGSSPASGLVEYAVERLGPERILFGSDIPCRCYPSQLGRIYGAKISLKARKMILRENSASLLGMKQ